jgi:hypothetical protein
VMIIQTGNNRRPPSEVRGIAHARTIRDAHRNPTPLYIRLPRRPWKWYAARERLLQQFLCPGVRNGSATLRILCNFGASTRPGC